MLNFAIVLLLLTKFAWNPLLKVIAERQARIAGQIEAADQERVAAEKLRAEYQQQMQNAKGDAQSIMDDLWDAGADGILVTDLAAGRR